MLERELKRYAAYFRGWCQAFGEHEGIHVESSGVDWLIADHQVGLVLPRPLIKPLHREVLLHREVPTLVFETRRIRVGSFALPLHREREQAALDAIALLLSEAAEAHVYLTSHLVYGAGNRIITFSTKKPLSIIYKEIGTMRVRFG
jgi:hypothetical protein